MIMEGSAQINQAAITGESLPVNRGIDEMVFSKTFARILKLVEEAQDKKVKTQKFLEKFWVKAKISA